MDNWSPRPEHDMSPSLEAAGVNAIDQQILALLSQRLAFTPFEASSPLLNDEHRRETLALVRRQAFKLGIPVGLVGDFWDRMMDAAEAMHDRAAHRPPGS